MPALRQPVPNYRRNLQPGGTFFFTVVTAHRVPIFKDPSRVELLQQAVRQTKRLHPFDMVAWVVLPDHLHMIWTLPPGDARYDRRWSAIKGNFSRAYLAAGGTEQPISPGKRHKRRRGVWQSRYLEHTLRDEDDLEAHVHYIHLNPVKHGHADRPTDWPHSSLHTYLTRGLIPPYWNNPAPAVAAQVDATLLDLP